MGHFAKLQATSPGPGGDTDRHILGLLDPELEGDASLFAHGFEIGNTCYSLDPIRLCVYVKAQYTTYRFIYSIIY